MFTGIVEELGRYQAHEGERFRFGADKILEGVSLGDSIAVNGCCLTVVDWGPGWWEADVSDETLDRTNLGAMRHGDPVNLERPMRPDGRLGGHIVLGHVDGIGHIVHEVPDLRVRVPRNLARYLVEKGSVAVDGVSLTCFALDGDTFDVAIIPHTSEVTTLGHRRVGDAVNIEMDILAKHVERLIEARLPT